MPTPFSKTLISKTLFALAVALCATLAPAGAQPSETVAEEIEVTEVLLDVLVTDPRGDVIVGLDEDDFTVTEDGKAVELTSVSFYSNRRFLDTPGVAASLDLDPADVPVERYFLLFFQDMQSTLPRLMAQELEAGNRAHRWAESELSPNDYVAVLSYDRALELHLDFSTDRQAIAAAIDEASSSRGPQADWPSRRAAAEGPSLRANLPEGEELDRATRRIQKALEVIGEAAEAIPGRKNLIFFGLGFGDLNDVGFYTPDPRYYPPMVQALNDGNVAVYGIDLVPSAFSNRLLRRSQLGNSLSSLAADTGGRYYFNFVDFSTPLEEIDRDNNGYYLLSYRSEHPAGETAYQDVEVDTTNPRFEVRARRGYTYGG